ncbi:hypothetical protein [Pacificibacter marinus]|uniref:hypothetical protein n=1 Tax=Pacificibacter marinus TaxID=658057 RepID=UPI001C0675B0|nr:hypothetical protein [Pacificibacter marinus]MBU2867006.1 hypothetical protein [Pacificibacter marinus]
MTFDPATQTIRSRPNFDVYVAALIFIGNIAMCISFFNPEVQGYGDAVRGWRQFNALLAEGQPFYDENNQVSLRIVMALVSFLIVMTLRAMGLIKREVLITYLALPFSAYLATKLKVEFVFFPFALIALGLGWKREVMVILMLLGMTVFFDENNGLIIVLFRLSFIVLSVLKPKLYWIFILIAGIIFIDKNISLLFPFVPGLAAYNYTRDIVNPEFSYIESVIVFLSSMTIGIQPQIDYYFGFTYTVFFFIAALGKKLLSKSFYIDIIKSPAARSGFLTIMLFGSLTHAFQNARYYFFYVPGIYAIGGARANRTLIIISWPMTFFLAIYYRLYLGH